MQNRDCWSIIIAGLFLLMIACAGGAQLMFQHPGQISFAGIKRLAVAPVTGAKQALQLEQRLLEELEAIDFYHLVYGKELSSRLEPHQMNYRTIAGLDSQSLAEIGEWLKADGILFTDLKSLEMEFEAQGSEQIEKKVWTGEYERNQFGEIIEEEDSSGVKIKKKKLKLKILDQNFQIRKATIEVIFRLVEFRSAMTVGLWDKVEHYIDNTVIGNQSETLQDEPQIKQ
ncbi:MAG: hypothetical protein SCK70_16785, partial [bacterium]|nr:hypothetical protein [bacterium]